MSEQTATDCDQPATPAGADELLRSMLADLERVSKRYWWAADAVRDRYADRDAVFVSHIAIEIDGVVCRAREVAGLLAAVFGAWNRPRDID
jgi:hypothetical protein